VRPLNPVSSWSWVWGHCDDGRLADERRPGQSIARGSAQVAGGSPQGRSGGWERA